MTRSPTVKALVFVSLLLAPTLPVAAQPAVTKATASVEVVPGQPRVVVRITNLANTALDAWQLRLTYDTATEAANSVEVTADLNLLTGFESPFGPIRPGATQERMLAVPQPALKASVQLLMVAFDDSSSQGSASEFQSVLRKRERTAAVLDTWITELRAVANMGASQGRAQLKAASQIRRQQTDPDDPTAQALLLNIEELSNVGNDSEFLKRLAAMHRELAQQRRSSLRHTNHK